MENLTIHSQNIGVNGIILAVSTQSKVSYTYFASKTYTQLIQTMKKFVSRPEPCVVLSAPYMAMNMRVNQIIQDDRKTFTLPLVHVRLNLDTEDMRSVKLQCATQGIQLTQDPCYLFITNASYCIASHNTQLIHDLYRLQLNSKNTKITYFFESNIHTEQSREILGQTHLYTHTWHYPLLDSEDSLRFLRYLVNMWRVPLVSKSTLNKITHMCGGHTWLLKQAFREYVTDPKLNLDKLTDLPSMRFKLKLISEAHTQSERSILAGTQTGDSIDLTYLQNTGLLLHNKCTIPVLAEYLTRNTSSKRLVLQQGDIQYKGVSMRSAFSQQEYDVLAALLKSESTPLTRDEIADIIWGSHADEQYSVWAIEQLIRRIRTKLERMGLLGMHINNKRSVGYYIPSTQ